LCFVCPQVPLKNQPAARATAFIAQLFEAEVEAIVKKAGDGGIREVTIKATPAVEGPIQIDKEVMEFKPCRTIEVYNDLVRWAREGYLIM